MSRLFWDDVQAPQGGSHLITNGASTIVNSLGNLGRGFEEARIRKQQADIQAQQQADAELLKNISAQATDADAQNYLSNNWFANAASGRASAEAYLNASRLRNELANRGKTHADTRLVDANTGMVGAQTAGIRQSNSIRGYNHNREVERNKYLDEQSMKYYGQPYQQATAENLLAKNFIENNPVRYAADSDARIQGLDNLYNSGDTAKFVEGIQNTNREDLDKIASKYGLSPEQMMSLNSKADVLSNIKNSLGGQQSTQPVVQQPQLGGLILPQEQPQQQLVNLGDTTGFAPQAVNTPVIDTPESNNNYTIPERFANATEIELTKVSNQRDFIDQSNNTSIREIMAMSKNLKLGKKVSNEDLSKLDSFIKNATPEEIRGAGLEDFISNVYNSGYTGNTIASSWGEEMNDSAPLSRGRTARSFNENERNKYNSRDVVGKTVNAELLKNNAERLRGMGLTSNTVKEAINNGANIDISQEITPENYRNIAQELLRTNPEKFINDVDSVMPGMGNFYDPKRPELFLNALDQMYVPYGSEMTKKDSGFLGGLMNSMTGSFQRDVDPRMLQAINSGQTYTQPNMVNDGMLMQQAQQAQVEEQQNAASNITKMNDAVNMISEVNDSQSSKDYYNNALNVYDYNSSVVDSMNISDRDLIEIIETDYQGNPEDRNLTASQFLDGLGKDSTLTANKWYEWSDTPKKNVTEVYKELKKIGVPPSSIGKIIGNTINNDGSINKDNAIKEGKRIVSDKVNVLQQTNRLKKVNSELAQLIEEQKAYIEMMKQNETNPLRNLSTERDRISRFQTIGTNFSVTNNKIRQLQNERDRISETLSKKQF